MSDSYMNLLYHLVFSTKDRRPLITPDYEVRLYDYIGGTIRDVGGISLALNGTEDHLHLLAKLRPDRALSDVLRKGSTSQYPERSEGIIKSLYLTIRIELGIPSLALGVLRR